MPSADSALNNGQAECHVKLQALYFQHTLIWGPNQEAEGADREAEVLQEMFSRGLEIPNSGLQLVPQRLQNVREQPVYMRAGLMQHFCTSKKA